MTLACVHTHTHTHTHTHAHAHIQSQIYINNANYIAYFVQICQKHCLTIGFSVIAYLHLDRRYS